MIALLESINHRIQGALGAQQDVNVARIEPSQAYTRTQAARLLRVSVWTIDRARKEGSLIEARRIGQRDVRITGASLLKFTASKEAASVRVRRL